ncbi:MAG: hypothetical protein M1820_005165 [Bogoriella megaspora]|nr:MAG: hypothetical protein M1820_005165 [Bogoriella megaspora]
MPIFHDVHEDSPPEGDIPSEAARTEEDNLRNLMNNARNDTSRPSSRLGSHYPFSSLQGSSESYSGHLTGSGISRGELIQRLKRAQSPVQVYPRPTSKDHSRPTSRSSNPRKSPSPLLPAFEFRYGSKEAADIVEDLRSTNWNAGIDIERPRSALHSGDFRKEASEATKQSEIPREALAPSSQSISTSPPAPWHGSFPVTARKVSYQNQALQDPDLDPVPARSRAISQSFTRTGFFYQPPSTPLVQQSNNTDLGLSPRSSPSRHSRSPDANRRRTFSPQSFQILRVSSDKSTICGSRATPALRRDTSAPYKAHQPRRSLGGFHSFSASTPQTPQVQPRRPSIADVSPLNAAMVGSYEESILRGRMSTTPSRPLNFVAQIGVLGRGKCKPQLRCPPHAIVPFPAVFYSYAQGNGRRSSIGEDSPSPYVGLVDLEHSLPSMTSRKDSRRRQYHTTSSDAEDLQQQRSDREREIHNRLEQRKLEKMKRRSTSPKAPPGGSYRIPQQGQLQIVLKNPNKTAVKLFLVPYDLSDMPPGTKTFIRQRSYSAGPIIDMPVSFRKNLGTDRPEAALSASDDPNERPVLRYLVHLHICCPSKGRYFLYKSIRVVFANRVPDGKEKLRNEIQHPEPRYSTYKPSRDSNTGTPANELAADRMSKRRSAGLFPSVADFDRMDGITSTLPPPARSFSSFQYGDRPVEPIPFNFTRLQTLPSRPGSRESARPGSRQNMDLDGNSISNSDGPLGSPSMENWGSPGSSMSTDVASVTSYDKLVRGESGYPASPPEGLLAKRLRGLDVQRRHAENDDDLISDIR